MQSPAPFAAMPLFSKQQPGIIVGYAAVRPHDRGFFYLAVTATGEVVERASYGNMPVDGGYTFPTASAAQAAITTWERQHPHG